MKYGVLSISPLSRFLIYGPVAPRDLHPTKCAPSCIKITKKEILCKYIPYSLNRLYTCITTFVDDLLKVIMEKRGSTIRFNNLRLHLIKAIPESQLETLKKSLRGTYIYFEPESSKTIFFVSFFSIYCLFASFFACLFMAA
jgi:hypothetical protein